MSIGHDQAATLLGSLSSLIRAARAVGARHSREMGASGTPLGVLKTLLAGDTRPGDLAVALHVAPSVVSRAIVPLEQEGLVERTTDPCDGRAALIGLTDLGRERLAQLQDAYVEQVSQLLHGWSDADVLQAAELMDRLEHALTEESVPESHQRLVSSALIPTTLPAGPSPDLTDDPSDHLVSRTPYAPAPVDSDVDSHPAASTRKPVHA